MSASWEVIEAIKKYINENILPKIDSVMEKLLEIEKRIDEK